MTSAPASLVRLEKVGRRFANGTEALAGVDLDIRAGSFTTLLGPSGCGKSTILRLIAGLLAPSSGAIAWPGGAAATPGDIGFVFQEPTLMPWSTALGNVMLPLELARVDRAQATARAMAALQAVGLAGFERAVPRELSGGMQMRVSIARAMVTEPRLLLMDEPFAALDEITRGRLNDDLLALWASRRFTCILVTHSVYESVYLAQRIVVMSARPGRVVADLVVDAPYPRDPGFRLSEPYAEHCRRASAALAGAAA
ncbi:MAG: ABC transporter ATP-binding protein [Alphaproteobacteria bacterium]|nr:ABC transporter ATP-binding protein [Alphaproteobacteria bacterium]